MDARELAYNLSCSISWSTLSGLGNAKVARLTIFMPIIGYLIVFNGNLATWIAPNLPTGSAGFPTVWDRLFEQNLVFLYFGLLTLGIAVSLFTVFAPQQVRRFPFVEDYLTTMEAMKTRNLVQSSFGIVVRRYYEYLNNDGHSSKFAEMNFGFPADISFRLHDLVKAAFEDVDRSEFSDDHLYLLEVYYSGEGGVLTERVLDMLNSSSHIDWFMQHLTHDKLYQRSKDIYFLEHRTMDYSRPTLRFVIAILYVLGLILTAIPTLLTSIIILKGWP